MALRRFALIAVLGLSAALFLMPLVAPVRAAEPGILVPEGFEVTRFAGDELAHDIFSIATDAQGRIAVSGPGYVKILEDRDSDGAADHAHEFCKIKSGALGMYFDGPDLIYTGDNKVARLRDSDGDRIGDQEEVWTELGHQEHGSHHIVKGPDGWYYIAAGNDAGISKKHITTAGSPIKDPVCGGILRFSPDGKQIEVIADGFRNMCGLDFNSAGHLFTVDSDNERDQHLPWYCPTRLFDVAIGQSHGWVQKGWQQGWNKPQYFFDSVERLVEIGRGSPTGVVVYRHRAWPKRYRDGVFSACWSMGRIYFFPLTPHGSSYKSKLEIFLEGKGATGLAIVGMTIDPAGDMYFAVGGRKTQGSVYRIRYTGPREEPTAAEQKQEKELRAQLGDKLYDVLTADQPLSNWSRAKWEPAARKLGKTEFAQLVRHPTIPSKFLLRAIEVAVDLFDGLSDETAAAAAAASTPEVVARTAWALARSAARNSHRTLFGQLVQSQQVIVRRAAWESLLSLPPAAAIVRELPSFGPAESHLDDRRVRAAQVAAYRLAPGTYPVFDKPWKTALFRSWAGRPTIEDALSIWRETRVHEAHEEAVRVFQKALGDVPYWTARPELYVGYQVNIQTTLSNSQRTDLLRHVATSDMPPELARLLAMLEVDAPDLVQAVARRLHPNSEVTDEIHYLIALSRLPGERTSTDTHATARSLVDLHHRMQSWQHIPSRNWPLRVGELFEELCKKDPKLAEAVINDEKFALPAHALFVSKMTGETQVAAAQKLLSAVVRSEADWDTDLVATLAVLPRDELWPHLRERFDEPALSDSIALVLAQSPAEDSRALLVEALSSVQPNVVRAVAEGLAKLDKQASPDEIAAALVALQRQTLAPNERATRLALVALLERWTAQKIDIEEQKGKNLTAAYRPWFDWFSKEHPQHSAKIKTFAGDWESWQARLAKIDWSAGDVPAGKAIYEKRSCQRCHSISGRLGPDLVGAAARFSREDLFGAIVDPSKEVAPPYQTTEVVTDDGQVYNGLVVYESPDTTMLQTGPDTVVRVGGVRKDAMRKSSVSLMPAGLLNDASDRELADLYAYLKTLAK